MNPPDIQPHQCYVIFAERETGIVLNKGLTRCMIPAEDPFYVFDDLATARAHTLRVVENAGFPVEGVIYDPLDNMIALIEPETL
ncbi:hypothetical protein [Lewinella sp. W8]|uniref:hypothetical protein n=1 Tax=Lewinella sp. W8 TaxID=2528208 RepID=UPI001566F78D|nr:hypothetical protein [Lewinella sp. W8]